MKNTNFFNLTGKRPHAVANVYGSNDFPDIKATVEFYQTNKGVLVLTYASGLPSTDDICKKYVFGMHIHSGTSCTGNETDYFADAMMHYNPDNCAHPHHSGDMPPLFEVKGFAVSMFLTDRFSVKDILGKTVIIHRSPDDFTTQPAGNSGKKIACGVITNCQKVPR